MIAVEPDGTPQRRQRLLLLRRHRLLVMLSLVMALRSSSARRRLKVMRGTTHDPPHVCCARLGLGELLRRAAWTPGLTCARDRSSTVPRRDAGPSAAPCGARRQAPHAGALALSTCAAPGRSAQQHGPPASARAPPAQRRQQARPAGGRAGRDWAHGGARRRQPARLAPGGHHPRLQSPRLNQRHAHGPEAARVGATGQRRRARGAGGPLDRGKRRRRAGSLCSGACTSRSC